MSRENARVPAAANPWLSRQVVVESIERELPDVCTFHLRFRLTADAEAFHFRPGQFNMLYVPGVGEAPISLSGAPGAGGAGAHTIRAVGNVTRSILRMDVGESLGLRGPFGSYWPLDEARGRDIVIVAGGIGLAPLRAVLDEILVQRASYGQVTLLYGSRTPASQLYAAQFADWTAQGISVQVTVDQYDADWRGHVGVVSLLLDRLPIARPQDCIVLTCGPEVMMKYVVRSAQGRGIATSQIWCSLERNMQCAVGLCGHCQLGPEFLCKDGPVFRYDRVMPLLCVERL